MDEKIREMPFLRNIGLVMTYKCQVTCPHCIIEAGPHRKEEVLLEHAFNWIHQVAEYRSRYIKVVSLTGGEPFFNLDNLRKISAFAEECGLLVSVVTNAFWASTRTDAVRILNGLKAIKMLSISTDVYHQESIPFERVKNAIDAAKESGVPYSIAVCTENEDDAGYKEVLRKLSEISETDSVLTAVTFAAGRALTKLHNLRYQTVEEPPISACSAGSSPIVFPDGRVTACIGPIIDLKSRHPLLLGNLHESPLRKILDKAEVNPILHAIRIWGPRKLISMIKEKRLNQYLPQRYIKGSICNACYSLMANNRIVEFLSELNENREFKREVAYARVYFMKEPQMVELLGINN
jgi:MoaA/NifB/PqqE/SkfB family radical SAM enzyme